MILFALICNREPTVTRRLFHLESSYAMRLLDATITNTSEIAPGMHLIEMHAPSLAHATQPGQYCMVRCCDAQASDPLLRRPFFIYATGRRSGLCSLLISVRGRGSSWLAKQSRGAILDILGPLGHGWTISPTARNLLLVSEGNIVSALTLLAQVASEQDINVTLISRFAAGDTPFPPTLLPPEVEYLMVSDERDFFNSVSSHLPWADAVYCAVARETIGKLYAAHERLRRKHFAQAIMLRPLVCGNGICLTCSVETATGPKLVCTEGPVFYFEELA
jgi:dihydroorotate dehydrogenase electron transfer subunit